uniref:Uncharacterized protein n=1 Tax=Anopheles dirus TaxID=7168 RepID=A0A182NX63_9DIPT
MFGEATRESCNICFLLFCFASLGCYVFAHLYV